MSTREVLITERTPLISVSFLPPVKDAANSKALENTCPSLIHLHFYKERGS